MRVIFVDDCRQQAEMFKKKLKSICSSCEFVWLDHYFKLGLNSYRYPPDIIVLDYLFMRGFRSHILFDVIAELNVPTYLYTTCSKAEVLADLKKAGTAWPVNMIYHNKADFTIFKKLTIEENKCISECV